MGWLKIDDKIAGHPKILEAGAEAAWMWLAAIGYGQNHLTDGFVSTAALPTLGVFKAPASELAEKLVAVRLFEAVEGGYLVHDYHDQNPSKQVVLKRREEAAARKAAQRSRESAPEGQDGYGDVTALSHVDIIGTESVDQRDSRARVPTPTPTPTAKTQERVTRPSDDGTLLARFERFWRAYPRKDGRKPAWRSWQRLKPSDATTDLLVAAVERQRRSRQWQEPQFVPHAATWLNQERWDDGGIEASGSVNGSGYGGLSPVCRHEPRCASGDACKRKQLDDLKANVA